MAHHKSLGRMLKLRKETSGKRVKEEGFKGKMSATNRLIIITV